MVVKILSALLLLFILFSCKNPDMKKMAADVCSCMDHGVQNLSDQTKNIIIKAGQSKDPAQSVSADLEKIKGDSQFTIVANEIQEFADYAKSAPVLVCLTRAEQANGVNTNDSTVLNKIIEHMKEKDDCKIVYVFLKAAKK